MTFVEGYQCREEAISTLFQATFTASEGAEEGKLIGDFVRDMMATTPEADLIVWSAYEDTVLAGCIFLSRLSYPEDDRVAFILSPVAVKTGLQKTGIGQKLISHGLNDLRTKGVDVVVTYGSPDYYARTGFRQITEDDARAPLKLSFPEGWLGQALSEKGDTSLTGPSHCVAALNNPALW